ncbi:hypothetical protein [Lysobacter capsici]|uniref:hypothetical protein n=1 Tax=Lysobacter capsici TaxID=435897 RepID=UPI001BFFF52D|nr:hypothetical protein [Lysobacter capsici]QWF17305.1 hypothetical protein KME82_00400 [Lysobacter capsici]
MTASSSRSLNDGSHGHGARTPSLLKSLLYAACIVVAVALVVVVTSATPGAFDALLGPPRAATAAEQRAILIAVIDHRQLAKPATRDAHGAQRRLALVNTTAALCGQPRQRLEPCAELPSQLDNALTNSHNLSDAMIDALPRFNAEQTPLDTRTLPGVVPVDRERVAADLAKGFSPEFQQAYPQVDGIVRVSRPVVSGRGDQALLYVETASDYQGGNQLELFALERGQWKFVDVVGVGSSWIR